MAAMTSEWAFNERRALWLTAVNKPTPRDPLLDALADDPVVAELIVSATQLRNANMSWLGCLVICPCIIPFCLVNCTLCKLTCCKGTRFEDPAKARHLILREKSLLYSMDVGKLEAPNISWWRADRLIKHDIGMVFPLDDNVALVRGKSSSTAMCYSVDTLRIMYKGGIVATVDFPENVDEFISLFEEQKAKAKLSPRVIDPSVYEANTAILEYMRALATSEPPSMARHGNEVNSEIDKARMNYEAKGHFEKLEKRLGEIRGLGAVSHGAPHVAEIVRDAPLASSSSMNASGVSLLSVAQVLDALNALGLEEYCGSFERAGVDGAMMSIMDDATLKELGVASGIDRKKLLAWVIRQKQTQVETAIVMS